MALISYRYCHFPPEIIQHTVWLYARFILSFCDVEEPLAERGIQVSYESIDQNGEILDVLVQAKREKKAALKLLRNWSDGSTSSGPLEEQSHRRIACVRSPSRTQDAGVQVARFSAEVSLATCGDVQCL